VRPVDVRISVQNQFPAIPVALPFSDHFHIDAELNRTRDERDIRKFLPSGTQ
jgi:hypothetical protein